MAAILQVENLSKRFGDKVLFENISFGMESSQRIALIARNGAGKSTLLSILIGEEDYQSGRITFRKNLRISILKQTPNLNLELNVLDACLGIEGIQTNLIREYEHITRKISLGEYIDESQYQQVLSKMDELKAWNYESRIKQILGKLKIHNLFQPIKELSGGQLKRIALANALISEPELLILDEPTNHLDLEMIEWLEDFLHNTNIALLMVTHDRYFLDKVCTDILEIDNTALYHYKGNYSYFLEKKKERQQNFNVEKDKACNLYRRELEWIHRQPQARGTKSRSRIEAFSEIEQRAKQRHDEKILSLEVMAQYIGNKIFEAKYISKKYGGKILLKDFYYNFSRYEKLGIVGKNGTGKSTFLKMLLGLEPTDSGSFDIGDTVSFGYYSQECIYFDEQTKVIDVIRNIAEEISLGNGKKMSASQFLTMFLFPPEVQYNYVYKLSGGERRRLHLCCVLIKNPNFLILDEPTNDLDIVTLQVLEEYLIGFQGCVIVVSHDRFFMDKVVDHIFAFEGNGVIKDYPGNYTDYREWKTLLLDEEKSIEKKNKITNDIVKKVPNREKKLSYKEQLEYNSLEKEISALEIEKSEIEKKLSGEETDINVITQLSLRIEEIIQSIDKKTLRWLEISEKIN